MQLNQIYAIANLTKEPQAVQTQYGVLLNFSVAINRHYKVKQEMKQETVFVDCVYGGKDSVDVEQSMTVGSQIMIVGRLKQDNWKDKEGNNKTKLKIQVEKILPVPNYGGGQEEGEQNG